MGPKRILAKTEPGLLYLTILVITFICLANGCTYVEGNYPPGRSSPFRVAARIEGEGFQLLAGSRLRIERVESDLEIIRSQGLSPRDPQIIKSIARRNHVPPALLADRTGFSYYRFTACLAPGTDLALTPGALELTVKTRHGNIVTRDGGYLVEDRLLPGGCRPSRPSGLVLESPEIHQESRTDFLVRCPVQGEIVEMAIVPGGVVTSASCPGPDSVFSDGSTPDASVPPPP
jgi:hypothetical protein